MKRMLLMSLVTVLTACGTPGGPAGSTAAGGHGASPTATPVARVQTEPVPSSGDAADDPAIWVHPTHPAKSLILGTDKKGGLHLYDMAGRSLQLVAPGSRPNNVDVLYGFPLGTARVDLAIAGMRGAGTIGVKVWRINGEAQRLEEVTAAGVIRVFNGTEPYGSCVYRSARTGKYYFFVNNRSGAVEQYELRDDGAGRVAATRRRAFKCGSITEGCVADDELGFFYIAEEEVGIWKFPAEPDAKDQGTLIARVGEHGLTSNVEGLTLYCGMDAKGYLIASSQGDDTFKVYQRGGDHAFVMTIDPRPGAISDVYETDGIAASNCPAGPMFPQGIFIAQDGDNTPAHQNFKLYGWEDIAGTTLLIDTQWTPRGAVIPR